MSNPEINREDWLSHLGKIKEFGYEQVYEREVIDRERRIDGRIHQVVFAHPEHKLVVVTNSMLWVDDVPIIESAGSTTVFGNIRGPVGVEADDHFMQIAEGSSPPAGDYVFFRRGIRVDEDWWVLDYFAKRAPVNWDVLGERRFESAFNMSTHPELVEWRARQLDHSVVAGKLIEMEFLAFAPEWVRRFILDPPD